MNCVLPAHEINFADNRVRRQSEALAEPPQLTETLRYDAAPWIYVALMTIHDKEQSGELLPGIGDFRVTPAVADSARQAVLSIRMSELPAPQVSHLSGGGLSLIWTVREKRIEIDALPDGEVTLSIYEDDNLLNCTNLVEIRDHHPLLLISNTQMREQFEWLLRR